MGRPDQGNKAQTPVGYSHGIGVSPGGLATAVLGVVARDTPGVDGVVWGRATSLPALRFTRCGAPWESYTGLRGQQCPHGLIVRYWQAAYDGQRDVTGRASLMVSRTAPKHEGQTGMLHPPAPGRRIQQ